MKLRLTVALALALAACVEAPPPSAVNPTTVAPPPPPSLSSPPLPQPICPSDVPGAAGKACSMEGQACGDPAKAGSGILCRSGVWQAGELPHPPCCKK